MKFDKEGDEAVGDARGLPCAKSPRTCGGIDPLPMKYSPGGRWRFNGGRSLPGDMAGGCAGDGIECRDPVSE